MSTTTTDTIGELSLADVPAGLSQIPQKTILTRLNYYDGKFLRADDLRLEQDYARRLAELGARAGGSGVVYGFDVSIASEALTLGGGLAFDAAGRVLYLPSSVKVGLQDVIDATRRVMQLAAPPTSGSSGFAVCEPSTSSTGTPAGPAGAEFYVVSIAHAEDACGDEDVFGKLCDDGCATSTDRAYLVEGVVVRAAPYLPATPFATSKAIQLTDKHVRSLVASAAFADEWKTAPSLISKTGLASDAWCTGAPKPTGWELPIAIVLRLTGGTYVDEWIVRRERMDVPPRRFWAWSMAMRPWESYLAQILQFQCQLADALTPLAGEVVAIDPCRTHVDMLREVARYMDRVDVTAARPPTTATDTATTVDTPPPATDAMLSRRDVVTSDRAVARPVLEVERMQIDPAAFIRMRDRVKNVVAKAAEPSQHILVDAGFVELPPAGYLPVTPGATPPVDEQVRRLMGAGVDLRFCTTTPDYVAHALEEAQHMERISLVRGLDDATAKPKVDIYVPNGTSAAAPVQAEGWKVKAVLSAFLLGVGGLSRAAALTVDERRLGGFTLEFDGAGRSASSGSDGTDFRFAAVADPGAQGGATSSFQIAAYADAHLDRNPFKLSRGDTFTISGEGAVAETTTQSSLAADGTATATCTITDSATQSGGGQTVTASVHLDAQGTSVGPQGDSGSTSQDMVLELELRADTTPPTVTATLTSTDPTKEGDVLLWATWAGDPLEIVVAAGQGASADSGSNATARATIGSIKLPPGPIARVEAAATLDRDDGVFTAGDANHDAAVTALAAIADGLDDTRYTGEVETKLFDRTATGNGGTTVAATLDWVLFQRRRIADCGATTTAPPQATTKHQVRYVQNPEETRGVLFALQKRDLATALKASQRIGDAEFGGGSSTLVTPAGTLRNAWNAVAGSAPLTAYVAAEAATIASSKQLLGEQAQAIGMACGGRVKLAGPFPNTPMPTGDEAITFLVGDKKVGAAAYAVYGVGSDNGTAWDAITRHDFDAFWAVQGVQQLGYIEFDSGTTNPVGTPSLTQLSAVLNATDVINAFVLTRPDRTTGENVGAQTDEIIVRAGGSNAGYQLDQGASSSDSTWPVDASLVCVLGVGVIT